MGARGLVAVGVPPLPRWLLFVKGAIVFLSIIVLALAAYALSVYNSYYYYGGSGVPGYLIFLAIMTWIIYGVSIAIELKAPHVLYRIAFLIFYIVSILFWLAGWAWSASWAALLLSYDLYDGYYNTRFGAVMAANAGIGAIIFILAIINLICFIVASCRGTASTGNVELGQAQMQSQAQGPTGHLQQPAYGQPQQQPTYGQPQQQPYVQQPYASQ